MSETIRDVVVNVRLKLADDKAMKGATDSIRKSTAETTKQAGAAGDVSVKLNAQQQIQKKQLEIQRQLLISETAKENRLKAQIGLESQKLKLQQQQEKIAAGGGSKPGVGSGDSSAVKPQGQPGVGGGAGMVIGKLFAAAMIVEHLPDALKNVASGEFIDKLAVVGVGLVEGLEGVIVGLSGFLRDMILAMPFGKDIGKLKPTLGAGMRSGLEKIGIDAGGTIEERKREILAGKIQRQADLEQQRIDIVRKLIPAESDLLRIAKEKMANAKVEFGMMNAREREDIVSIARRTDTVGFGGLGSDEADKIRKNPAIAALFAKKAAAQAESGDFGKLFGELMQRSGTSSDIAKEQAAQNQKNRAAIMQINNLHIMDALSLNIDPTKLAEQMTTKVAPILTEALRRTAEKLSDDLARSARIADGARAAAGAGGRLR